MKRRYEYRFVSVGNAPGEQRPARLMSTAEGYAMVRRPGCHPFIIDEQAWLAADLCDRKEKADG